MLSRILSAIQIILAILRSLVAIAVSVVTAVAGPDTVGVAGARYTLIGIREVGVTTWLSASYAAGNEG